MSRWWGYLLRRVLLAPLMPVLLLLASLVWLLLLAGSAAVPVAGSGAPRATAA